MYFSQLVGGDALYNLWDDLVRQLEDLCYLQKELQFSISLAQHSKVVMNSHFANSSAICGLSNMTRSLKILTTCACTKLPRFFNFVLIAITCTLTC